MEKKHPCPDCQYCQWCSDVRCAACLGKGRGCGKMLSMAEQIELYERINREFAEKKSKTAPHTGCCCKK